MVPPLWQNWPKKPHCAPRPRKRTGRNRLPPKLPQIEHRHDLDSCACAQRGPDLVKIGYDISESHGVPIARSTLAQWVGQLGVSLQPLVDRLTVLLKQGKAGVLNQITKGCGNLSRVRRQS